MDCLAWQAYRVRVFTDWAILGACRTHDDLRPSKRASRLRLQIESMTDQVAGTQSLDFNDCINLDISLSFPQG